MKNRVFYEIISHSMYPTLAPGDKVVCAETSNIKINDIVAINPGFFLNHNKDPFFHVVLQEDVPVIHRVVDIKEVKNGERFYKTKGDFTWRVDGAFNVIEENEEILTLLYDESKAFIPGSKILGKIVKIIKKSITCPSCSKEFIAEKRDIEFDTKVMDLMPNFGLKFEVKVLKNGEQMSRFM